MSYTNEWKKRPAFLKEVGLALRKIRKARGLTQLELASRASLAYRHYQDIETGRVDVQLSTIQRLAEVLKLKPWEIFAP